MDSLRKRYFTNGDPSPVSPLHAPYLHVAQVLLGMVKQRMQMGNLQQLWQQYTTEDGATIRAMSRFGQDEIWIDVPHAPANPVREIERKAKYGRFLIATGPRGNIYQLNPQSLRLELATDLEVTGCPAHIAATHSHICITDNYADYYKYGSTEWETLRAAQQVTHPAVRFYSRQWEETGSYTPYTSYGELWQTNSCFGGVVPAGRNFLVTTNISRFWGFTVGGGDNEYYIDQLDGNGALQSHVTSYQGDPSEWAVASMCEVGQDVRASLVEFPYAGTAYVTPTYHTAIVQATGADAIEPVTPLRDHIAAEDGRLYALQTEAPWTDYTIVRVRDDGVIGASVAAPNDAIYPLREPRPGGGFVGGFMGRDDRDNPSIRTLETHFPSGRMAAGSGLVVIIGKLSRFSYALYVYSRNLELRRVIPLDAALGFVEGAPAGAWGYLLPSDYTVAIGYDPHWIPEHITEKRPDFGAK